jgi:hypothetical protein
VSHATDRNHGSHAEAVEVIFERIGTDVHPITRATFCP